MNVLIIGSGGRESALAWAVRKSPRVNDLYIAPGNGGTIKYGYNVNLQIKYPFKEIIDFVKTKNIEITIVGPEQPLVEGIVDEFQKNKIKIFGPSKGAARLEGSKCYLKEFLSKYSIPTAKFKNFDNYIEAIEFVEKENKPFVVKTDGLAAGKGAIVNKTVEETLEAIHRIMVKKEFGEAGNKIVVEDVLKGEEISVFIATDGKNYCWLGSAQDHKRIFDFDEGPNTGGMGAYSPVPFLDDNLKNIIEENIIKNTIFGMQREGHPYKGILYLGLMLTDCGPVVLEYNVRLGDPEAQVILPLLNIDFIEIVEKVVDEKLFNLNIKHKNCYCTTVVMASRGYPGNYVKGFEITGDLSDYSDSFVFHSGTKINQNNKIVTDGGRVLSVSALGKTLKDSIENAYSRVYNIQFEGAYFRKDIGAKGLKYIENKK